MAPTGTPTARTSPASTSSPWWTAWLLQSCHATTSECGLPSCNSTSSGSLRHQSVLHPPRGPWHGWPPRRRESGRARCCPQGTRPYTPPNRPTTPPHSTAPSSWCTSCGRQNLLRTLPGAGALVRWCAGALVAGTRSLAATITSLNLCGCSNLTDHMVSSMLGRRLPALAGPSTSRCTRTYQTGAWAG